jgi:hypothetical protein
VALIHTWVWDTGKRKETGPYLKNPKRTAYDAADPASRPKSKPQEYINIFSPDNEMTPLAWKALGGFHHRPLAQALDLPGGIQPDWDLHVTQTRTMIGLMLQVLAIDLPRFLDVLPQRRWQAGTAWLLYTGYIAS